MKKEQSAGFVIFRKENNSIFYLLLFYQAGHWGFPKGHLELGESQKETALRELEEETALNNIKIKEGFQNSLDYSFKNERGEQINKEVTYFLAETKTKEIKISNEHQAFKWLPYKEAINLITFANAKEVLKKANDFRNLIKE